MGPLSHPLSEAEKDHFRTNGFFQLKNCFSREQAHAVTNEVWTRLGMDPSDKSMWHSSRTYLSNRNSYKIAEFAPKAWSAICEGEDPKVPDSKEWRDGFIVRFGSPQDERHEVSPHGLNNWHVDGNFFVHYVDSREQGLPVMPYSQT